MFIKRKAYYYNDDESWHWSTDPTKFLTKIPVAFFFFLTELTSLPWIFIERTDAEAPILWPHDEKSWLIGKDPDAGKDEGNKRRGVAEDETAR